MSSVGDLLDLKDAMDGILESTDMLDDIDLCEFDFPVKVSELLLESSDSDSGISGITDQQAKPCLVNSSLQALSPIGPDCVLTDAICTAPLLKPVGCSGSTSSVKHEEFVQRINDIKFDHTTVAPITTYPNSHSGELDANGTTNLNNPTVSNSLTAATNVTNAKMIPYVKSNVSFKIISCQGAPSKLRIVHPSSNRSIAQPSFVNKSEPEQRCLNYLNTNFSCDNHADDTESDLADVLQSPDPTLEHQFNWLARSINTNSPEEMHVGNMYPYSTNISSQPSDSSEFSMLGNCSLTHANLERIRKKHERMIKNRHAACLSRLRKKEYLERLETKFEQLKRENLNLWRQNEEWKLRCSRLESCIKNLESRCVDNASVGRQQPTRSVTENIRYLPNSTKLLSSGRTACSSFSSDPSEFTTRLSGLSDLGKHVPVMKNFDNSRNTNSHESKWEHRQVPVFNNISRSYTNTITTQKTLKRYYAQTNNINRSKLVAGTSLLALFGLLSLNLLSPLLSQPMLSTSAINSGRQFFRDINSWTSLSYPRFGQRLLLSSISSANYGMGQDVQTPSVIDDNDDVSDSKSADCLTNLCHSDSGNLSITNSSKSDVGRVLQGWVGQYANLSLPQRDKLSKSYAQRFSTFDRDETKHGRFFDLIRNDSLTASTKLDSLKRVRAAKMTKFTFDKPAETSSKRTRPFDRISHYDVQPYAGQSPFAFERLMEYIDRRNDTTYFVLFNHDHFVLPPDEQVFASTKQRIIFLLPAYPLINTSRKDDADPSSHYTMVQLDCEVVNATFLRPGKYLNKTDHP